MPIKVTLDDEKTYVEYSICEVEAHRLVKETERQLRRGIFSRGQSSVIADGHFDKRKSNTTKFN